MKTRWLLSLLLLTVNVEAGIPYRYECDCIDTGAQCDGIDHINIQLQDDTISVQAKDRDQMNTDSFETQFDPKYNPIKYRNFDRYFVTTDNKNEYPYILVSKGITKKHLAKGNVKLIEKRPHSPYGWTWEFDCKFD